MSINVVTNERLLATFVTKVRDGGEKVIRQITRDVREADIVALGSSKELHFADVFKCIVAAIREDKVKVTSHYYRIDRTRYYHCRIYYLDCYHRYHSH